MSDSTVELDNITVNTNIKNNDSVKLLEPTQDKSIEIKRVESNEGVQSTPPSELNSGVSRTTKERGNIEKSIQAEPEPTKRKERKDKGKSRTVKHKKVVKSKFINDRKVIKVGDISKPKSNLGFKIGIGLGVIVGLFTAIFLYQKIKKRMGNTQTQIESDKVSIPLKSESEEERLNNLYYGHNYA